MNIKIISNLRFVIILIILSSALLVNCGGATPTPRPTPTTAAQIKIIDVVSAEGMVLPVQRASLSFKVGGRIAQVPVREGDAVKAGAVLARSDDKMLKAQVAQAQAAVQAAQTQLARLKANNDAQIQIAQAQLLKLRAGATAEELALAEARARQVYYAYALAEDAYQRFGWIPGTLEANIRGARDQAGAANTTAQAELARTKAGARIEDIAIAQAQLDLQTGPAAKAEIQAAEAKVDEAAAALKVAEANLQDTTILAPFDGTVSLVSIDIGQVVTAGTPAVLFANLAQMQVDTTDLAEVDVAKVQTGQTANVSVDAFPGKIFAGTVSRVSSAATERSGKKVFKVTVDLKEGGDAGLRWGMTANVEITVGK